MTRAMDAGWQPAPSSGGGGQIVLLQEKRVISLPMGIGQSETQAVVDAANVLPYRFITPWVRVLRHAANNLSLGGVDFDFFSAPYMSSPDEEDAAGALFKSLSYTVTITNSVFLGANDKGNIFTQTPVSGKIPPIELPGGLLIWKCSNKDASNPQVLCVEIVLVCREG